jgi:hypothetical protein
LYIPKQAFADLCAESLTLFPPSNGEPWVCKPSDKTAVPTTTPRT